MHPHSKDGFQALPQQVDYTCVTNAHMVGNGIRNDDNDEEVAAVVDTTTTTTRDRTSGKPLFRSKCHPDEIPDVARDVTWCDSFYENDTDVIAVFDMNRKMANRYLQIYIFYVIICILLIPCMGAGICFLMALLHDNESLYWRSYRLRRKHVAATRRGLYFDEVDEPGSGTIMGRLVIPYDQIDKMVVTVENDSCHLNYTVIIYRKNRQHAFKIVGLVGTQKFLDIVKAMMEHTRRRNELTNTEVPDNIETIAIEPTHEEDIIIAVAKLV
jgi:hypothetical protein